MTRIMATIVAGGLLLAGLLASGAGTHPCVPQWQYGGYAGVARWSEVCG